MSKLNSKTTCTGMDWNTMLGLLQRLKRDDRLLDYLLVATGCYFGLRIKDLLDLSWSDVIDKNEFTVTESKTGKKRLITLNINVKEVLQHVYKSRNGKRGFSDDDFLFVNRWNDKLTIQYVNRRLHDIFAEYNVRVGNGSSHTLRKTFGKRVWEMDGQSEKSLVYLSEIFSHSSINTTKRYIGIVQQNIENIYLNL
jgi:integrase